MLRDASDLQDYEGGRDYETLRRFVDESLKPTCSVKNIDLCEGTKKEDILKYQGMSLDDLKTAAAAEEKKLADAEGEFELEVEKLQAAYDKLSSEKEQKVADVKAAGLGLMKSVIKNREDGDKKDEL